MWQKLSRIDIYMLERVRTQLINAAQLISAAPRSYLANATDSKFDWLMWNADTSSISSIPFGSKEEIKISLDVEQFVISIIGINDHVEHLVLSGMTYPMAYGWMKIKLDAFHFDSNIFSDAAPYSIEKNLSADEEMNIINQKVVCNLAIYYSNAFYLLNELITELSIDGKTLINPKNLNLTIPLEGKERTMRFGFAPGDKDYPEPYFYIQFNNKQKEKSIQPEKAIGIWNSKNWNGFVFLASDFLNIDPNIEKEKVLEFFKVNYTRMIGE